MAFLFDLHLMLDCCFRHSIDSGAWKERSTSAAGIALEGSHYRYESYVSNGQEEGKAGRHEDEAVR